MGSPRASSQADRSAPCICCALIHRSLFFTTSALSMTSPTGRGTSGATLEIWSGRLGGGVHQELLGVAPGVDQLPGQEREQGRPHGPEIGLRVDLLGLAPRLLGRHEPGRPEGDAALGGGSAGPVSKARDAEVEDPELAVVGQEEVGRLDVAMDDAFGVRGGEDRQQGVGDGHRQLQGDVLAAPLPHLIYRRPLEELHHHERRAILGDVVVEDPHAPGVSHRVREVTLPDEPGPDVLVTGELGVEHLDREAGLVSVRGRVHHRHPAHAQACSN